MPWNPNIHPVATGRAAETVARHEDAQELVLWSGWFCPFNQRVWIALEEKGIPYQYKEVNPYKKEPSFLALNPRGLVPTVEYRGKPVYESTVLLEFLEEAYATHEPKLLPADVYERARIRIWIDHVNKVVVPAWHRLLQAQDADGVAAARVELYEGLRGFAAEVKGPYFSGEAFSLADAAIAPWVARDFIVAEHRGYERAGGGAAWEAYAARLAERDSVQRTSSSAAEVQVVHERYLRGDAESEAAKAVRAGRAIP